MGSRPEERGVLPDVAELDGCSIEPGRITARRPSKGAFDSPAAEGLVEGLRRGVLVEDPQVQPGLALLGHGVSCRGHQPRADTAPLSRTGDVEIVDKGAPCRVVVEHDVYEPHQVAV